MSEEVLKLSEQVQAMRDENRAYEAKLERKIAHVEAMLRGGAGSGAGAAALAAAAGDDKAGGGAAVATSAAGGRQPGVHVVVTSNGNRYMNWQTRVLYASYKQTVGPGVGADDAHPKVVRGVLTQKSTMRGFKCHASIIDSKRGINPPPGSSVRRRSRDRS